MGFLSWILYASFQNVKPNHKFSSTLPYDPWVLICGVKIVEPVNYKYILDGSSSGFAKKSSPSSRTYISNLEKEREKKL